MPMSNDLFKHAEPRRTIGRPNLMGDAAASSHDHASDPLRMLTSLDVSRRPQLFAQNSPPPAARWLAGAAALLMVVAGGAWWGLHGRAPNGLPTIDASSTRPAGDAPPAAREVLATETRDAAPTGPGGLASSQPAFGAATTAARIETLPNARPAAPVAMALAATPASATRPVAAVSRKAMAQKSAKAMLTQKGQRKEKAREKRLAARQGAPVSAASKTTRARFAATGQPTAPTAASGEAVPAAGGKDADIALLSALLAHVSRNGQAAPLAEPDQLTIAQVVQRCEARGGQEARECRRRICEGYWGKADACPAR